MKKTAGIIIILGIVVIIFLGFVFQKSLTTSTLTPQTLSNDPNYQEVKEKYNLSEEQLQILSTVNTQDSE